MFSSNHYSSFTIWIRTKNDMQYHDNMTTISRQCDNDIAKLKQRRHRKNATTCYCRTAVTCKKEEQIIKSSVLKRSFHNLETCLAIKQQSIIVWSFKIDTLSRQLAGMPSSNRSSDPKTIPMFTPLIRWGTVEEVAQNKNKYLKSWNFSTFPLSGLRQDKPLMGRE